MPIQFGSIIEAISREARLVTLPSPNLGAVTPCVNLVLTSEVTEGVANTAPVRKGTNKVLSRTAGTEALTSASHLRYKAKNKAPHRAKSEVTVTSLSKYSSAKFAPCGGATHLTSPSEVNTTDKVISELPKSRSFKAKSL